MKEELDQKLFNKALDIGDILIDKKYASSWFSWVEWCTLTAVLFVVASKSDSGIVYFSASLSALVLVIVGFASVNRVVKDILKQELDISGWWYILMLVPLFATPALVITIVKAIIGVLGE